MSPEVSVVIPTCNRREMVREAVLSVLAQRNVSFELIIVDDGSDDGSVDALCSLMVAQNDAVAVRITGTSRRGPAAARNHGVSFARGEFIAFLDSDDLWLPGKLERQVAFMRANPQFRLSQTQELWLRNGRRVNPGRRHIKRCGDFFIESLRTCLVSPSAVIMHADFFRDLGGFDEDMAACEDYDLWLRIMIGNRIGLLDKALVVRRAGHSGQLSAIVPALDRFRIVALLKLLACDRLGSAARRTAVRNVIAEKCEIYAHGLRRRERHAQAAAWSKIGLSAGEVKSPEAAVMLYKLARSLLIVSSGTDRGAMVPGENSIG